MLEQNQRHELTLIAISLCVAAIAERVLSPQERTTLVEAATRETEAILEKRYGPATVQNWDQRARQVAYITERMTAMLLVRSTTSVKTQ